VCFGDALLPRFAPTRCWFYSVHFELSELPFWTAKPWNPRTSPMPGRLTVQRPTPTTVSFTVSNAPLRSNSPAKILFGLQILVRAVLFCFVIVVGVTRLRRQFFDKGSLFIISWEEVWSSPLGAHVCRLVDPYNPWMVAVVSTLGLYGVFRRGYTGKNGLYHVLLLHEL
jgi:hypothetical protein